ncbi:MAG: isoprenylcysteine carboxylmethyltransferase family protein [Candidatus Omnitrophica bacterium]|nr:isoprenylcysteine carboxylmethyltransferase family protein [Candidatus Omnitrophota bacterium]MDD5592503.1 isoprenylcysteine carboxylmethyltransferase family protein [Candidatus Omnitrophota bacterium]
MKKRLKINGLIMFLAVVLILAFPKIFFRRPQALFWDGFANICGIALILLGQIFRASGRGYKSANSQNSRSLIERGPYTLVRNPMYLGILLTGLGVVLALFNFWALVIFLCVFIVRYIFLIFQEEKKLVAVFGQAYQDYQQRVPRLIPAWGALLKKDIAEYLPLKTLWLKKEIGSILAVLFVVFLIEGWNDALSMGLSMYLRKTVLTLSVIIVFSGLIIYLLKKTGER